jgi:hypothetical protein
MHRDLIVRELGGFAEDLDPPLRQFVGDTGFDQNGLLTGPDHDRVQSDGNVILGVGLHFLFPHNLGNDAEERSSVEAVVAVGDGGQFEFAKGQAVHESALTFHKFVLHHFILHHPARRRRFTFWLAGTPLPLIFWNHGVRVTLPPKSLSYKNLHAKSSKQRS